MTEQHKNPHHGDQERPGVTLRDPGATVVRVLVLLDPPERGWILEDRPYALFPLPYSLFPIGGTGQGILERASA